MPRMPRLPNGRRGRDGGDMELVSEEVGCCGGAIRRRTVLAMSNGLLMCAGLGLFACVITAGYTNPLIKAIMKSNVGLLFAVFFAITAAVLVGMCGVCTTMTTSRLVTALYGTFLFLLAGCSAFSTTMLLNITHDITSQQVTVWTDEIFLSAWQGIISGDVVEHGALCSLQTAEKCSGWDAPPKGKLSDNDGHFHRTGAPTFDKAGQKNQLSKSAVRGAPNDPSGTGQRAMEVARAAVSAAPPTQANVGCCAPVGCFHAKGPFPPIWQQQTCPVCQDSNSNQYDRTCKLVFRRFFHDHAFVFLVILFVIDTILLLLLIITISLVLNPDTE